MMLTLFRDRPSWFSRHPLVSAGLFLALCGAAFFWSLVS